MIIQPVDGQVVLARDTLDGVAHLGIDRAHAVDVTRRVAETVSGEEGAADHDARVPRAAVNEKIGDFLQMAADLRGSQGCAAIRHEVCPATDSTVRESGRVLRERRESWHGQSP